MAPSVRPQARLRPPGMLLRALLPLLLFSSLPGVWCFSELFFMKEPQDVTVARKDPVMLDCQAHGEVPIKVTWLKNGIKLSENKRIQVLSNGSLYISEVEGRRGEQSHEGYYQCLAVNKYGAILSQKAHLTLSTISAFEVQPVSTEVQDGGVARFACKISSNPPAVITWEFNRTALPMTVDRVTTLPTGVLQIYDVGQRDAGSYRCVAATVAHRRKSMEASLVVIPAEESKPFHTPTIIAGPQNMTVSLHQTVVLECMATGNPKPIISWSRLDHKSIDVFNTRVLGNGNLMISDVKLQHAGVYVCRATTPGTRNFTVAMATLTVLAPPSFVEWPESLTRPRAGTARFVCQAEGIPSPKMSWLKNGRKIHSNGRIKMYNSKLVINQIIPEDDAIYQCMAENSQGSVLSRARLTVVMSEDRPSAPYNVHAETMSSSAILLAWERPLYNSDKVIAYSVHYMKAEGLNNEEYQVVLGNDTTDYIIDDLEPASNYTFYIVAYMPMGASQMSDHVTQNTLEDVPLRPPEISLTSRSPTDILISWLPIPAKYRRGQVVLYRLSFRLSTESSIQVLELPGTTHEYLLEGLKPDSVYLVRISAATRVGLGESSVWTSHRTPKATSVRAPRSPELHLEPLNCTTISVKWQRDAEDTAAIQGYKLYYKEEGQQENGPFFLDTRDLLYTLSGLVYSGYYHLDQKSMTGIAVGVGIALTCILVCVLILIYRSKARKSASSKTAQNGPQQIPRTIASSASRTDVTKNHERAAENEDSLLPMIMPNGFLDAKGGTDLIINSYGPIVKSNSKKKWFLFQDSKKKKVEQPQRRFTQAVCFYQPGTTVLIGGEDSPSSPHQTASFPRPFSGTVDTEHSANSEGSHETGDSGRFSHESSDEIHLSSVISSTPPTSSSLTGSDSGDNPTTSKCEDPAVPSAAEPTPASVAQPSPAMLCFDKDCPV
ncbi:protogenin isoform X5 [Ochotona princeps]|uniref:protogenin isoform X5 n=1 Tax=Ochotona princeps TaxID=9978 RepID=UPI0027155A69|nr:protogenin isoform X5 [Ochotona princeps]